MTVKELITELKKYHDGMHVYINQENSGACALTQSVEYSDTMSDVDAEDDSNMMDGVIISSFKEATLGPQGES